MKPEDTFTSDDEAPEAVSMSTTKQSMVEQMKREKQAKLSAKEKRKAADQVKREQAEAKKKQIEAAMADFVTKASADKKSRDELERQQETKVIKFESDEDEEEETGTLLPDGSKIVLLDEPASLLTRRISENRAALLKTRQKLAANPLIQRIPVSNKVGKKRKQPTAVAMISRESVKNKTFRLSTFSL